MKKIYYIFFICLFITFSSLTEAKTKTDHVDISGKQTLVSDVDWENIKDMVENNDRNTFYSFLERHFKAIEINFPHRESGISAYYTFEEIDQQASELKKEIGFWVRTDNLKKAYVLFNLLTNVNVFLERFKIRGERLKESKKFQLFINVLDERYKILFKSKWRNNKMIIYVEYKDDYEEMKKEIFEKMNQMTSSVKKLDNGKN